MSSILQIWLIGTCITKEGIRRNNDLKKNISERMFPGSPNRDTSHVG